MSKGSGQRPEATPGTFAKGFVGIDWSAHRDPAPHEDEEVRQHLEDEQP